MIIVNRNYEHETKLKNESEISVECLRQKRRKDETRNVIARIKAEI